MIRLLAIALLTCSPMLTGCDEEEPLIVPDVPVSITINLQFPTYISLLTPGNAYLVPYEGYLGLGVIVFHDFTGEFRAFDATCPQHIESPHAVTLDERGSAGTATCSWCNARYFLYNHGASTAGHPLKRYRIQHSGTILTITN